MIIMQKCILITEIKTTRLTDVVEVVGTCVEKPVSVDVVAEAQRA